MELNDEQKQTLRNMIVVIIVVALIILAEIGQSGMADARKDREWQEKAVDAGKAEYYLDDHHERQWRWKP